MHSVMPPLSALRAFEAAARHLSLTQAAGELHVTAGALSHQIRGLEDLLGVKLFERRVRSIALTTAGKQLYPGLQTGFGHIREAVASLDTAHSARVLVVSTSPGLTSKWLAPRLYRFGNCPCRHRRAYLVVAEQCQFRDRRHRHRRAQYGGRASPDPALEIGKTCRISRS